MPKSTPMSPGAKAPSSAPGDAACPAAGSAAPCPCANAKITSQTVATMPSKRDRKKLGVGEPVRLTFSLGSANWTLTGTGTGLGKLSTRSGAIVTYTAPDRATSVSITATGSGCTASITLETIEPSGMRMERSPHTKGNHKKYKTSVGFIADVYILPADVSFQYAS